MAVSEARIAEKGEPPHTRRINHFRHSLLASTLAKKNASGRGVREHMASNRFATVRTGEQGTCARVRLDLVDDQHSDVELLCHLTELTEMLAQLSLTLVQLSTTVIVVAEMRHDAVDDEETVLSRSERLSQTAQLIVLVLAILCAYVENVFVGGLMVNCGLLALPQRPQEMGGLASETLRDLFDTLWAPCPFSVDDGNSSFSTTFLLRQLGYHSHGV